MLLFLSGTNEKGIFYLLLHFKISLEPWKYFQLLSMSTDWYFSRRQFWPEGVQQAPASAVPVVLRRVCLTWVEAEECPFSRNPAIAAVRSPSARCHRCCSECPTASSLPPLGTHSSDICTGGRCTLIKTC